jgi:hypothetical protein
MFSLLFLPVRSVDACGKWNPGNPSLSQKPLPSNLLDTLRNAIERLNLLSLKIRAFKQVHNDSLIVVRPAERDIYLSEALPQVYIGVTKREYSLYFHAVY